MTTPPDPPPGVVITPREIYDAVRELTGRVDRDIYDAVRELTGRVDIVIAQNEQLATRSHDHENRLRTLERARWPLPSVAAVVSIVALMLGAIPYFTT